MLAAIIAITSCGPDQNDPTLPEDSKEENVTENNTGLIDATICEYSGELADDASDDIIGEDADTYWEKSTFNRKITIRFNGSDAEVKGADQSLECHVSGADIAVVPSTAEGLEIVLEGKTPDGQLKIYGSNNVKLTLNGLELTSAKSSAINFQNKGSLFIHMADNTDNIICDASKQSDESFYPEGVVADDEKRNGAIYSKGNIVISGKGLLKVSGKKKHGISAKGEVIVRPGATLVTEDIADNCIKADGITILGGYIWATADADAGKCLSSDGDIEIAGGKLRLQTTGGSIYEADENDTSSPAGVKSDKDIYIRGGEILCISTGDGGKGLNADGNLTIDDGKIHIATSGRKYVYNSALDLDSSPKGVKADGNIEMNGGLLNIQVTGLSDGSEGLESKSMITINDGDLFVYAYDDAINVGGDNPVGLVINGGRVFAFADHNDGIDSNGKLTVNGGLVIASGSDVPEESFDCDNSRNFIVTGGTLIGTAGAAISTSTTSTQRSVIYNGISAKSGELIVICNSNEEPILMYELPRSSQRLSLFYSSAAIVSGESYKVYYGGQISGNTSNWNGVFADGTYSDGTELGEFTSNQLTVTIGTGGGPGGGPGGPGRPGGPGNGDGGWGPGWWE